MVGRFVEQQQVARRHQRAREVQAHAPAAGEIRHRLRVRFRREAQAVQQAAGARGGVVAVELFEPVVRDGDGFPVFVRERVGFHLDRVVHGLRRRTARSRSPNRAATAFPARRWRCAPCRAGRGRPCRAPLRPSIAANSEVLPRAVAADHADAPARMQGEVDVGQEEAFAAAEGEIAEGNHGARILAGLRPRKGATRAQSRFPEHQVPALRLDLDRIAADELARQDLRAPADSPAAAGSRASAAARRTPGRSRRCRARSAPSRRSSMRIPRSARRLPRYCVWMRAISRICALSSGWNTTISSSRLMNSGRKCACTTPITAAFICV